MYGTETELPRSDSRMTELDRTDKDLPRAESKLTALVRSETDLPRTDRMMTALDRTDKDLPRADMSMTGPYVIDKELPRSDSRMMTTLGRMDRDLPEADRSIAGSNMTEKELPRADDRMIGSDRTSMDLPRADVSMTGSDKKGNALSRADLESKDKNMPKTFVNSAWKGKDAAVKHVLSSDRKLNFSSDDRHSSEKERQTVSENILYRLSDRQNPNISLADTERNTAISETIPNHSDKELSVRDRNITGAVGKLTSTNANLINMSGSLQEVNKNEGVRSKNLQRVDRGLPLKDRELIDKDGKARSHLTQQASDSRGQSEKRKGTSVQEVYPSESERMENSLVQKQGGDDNNRYEWPPTQLPIVSQHHFGRPIVHSTPRVNPNSTIDREIENLDKYLERIPDDSNKTFVFEDTAKEIEFKRKQELERRIEDYHGLSHQDAESENDQMESGTNQKTSTAKRRVSFGPFVNMNHFEDNPMAVKSMSNFNRLKQSVDVMTERNIDRIRDVSEKIVPSRVRGELTEDKKDLVDNRLPLTSGEVDRDRKLEVEHRPLRETKVNTARKQSYVVPQGGPYGHTPYFVDPYTGFTKVERESEERTYDGVEGAVGYEISGENRPEQHFQPEPKVRIGGVEKDRLETYIQTDRESELLAREDSIRRKEDRIEQILKRLEIQEKKLKDDTEYRNRENVKELQLLKQKQEELLQKEEDIRRKEFDFESRIKRLEDENLQRLENSQTELKERNEQLQMAEARSKRSEHESTLREEALIAKVKEFEDNYKLKQQEESETRRINIQLSMIVEELRAKEKELKDKLKHQEEVEMTKISEQLMIREEAIMVKEKEFENKLLQEQTEIRETHERTKRLQQKEDQINIAEANYEKKEHELSLREESLRAREIEFEDKLKRRGEQGNSISDLIGRKEKLDLLTGDSDRGFQASPIIESSMMAKEMEFEARIGRLEERERQRMNESNRDSRIKSDQFRPSQQIVDTASVKDDEVISISNSSQINQEQKDDSKLKEDEFEARLNAMELAKTEMEKKLNKEINDSCGKDSATNVTQPVDRQFQFPKFSRFSGDEPRPKSEASYEEWKYEVSCAQESELHSEQVMAQAIRKSLANQAKRVIVPMGTKVTVKEILDRLETVFGNVVTGDSILEEFHSAAQKHDETVVAWGLRLEELMHKAISKGNVKREDSDNLLKRMFWRKLKSEKLRNATRSKFESSMNFDQLRKAVREEELEAKQGVQHQPMQQKSGKDEDTSKSDILLKKLKDLEFQMRELSKKQTEMIKKQKEHDQQQQQQGSGKQNSAQQTGSGQQNKQQSGK